MQVAEVLRQHARTAIDAMAGLGILSPVPDLYPATWAALELLDEVYG